MNNELEEIKESLKEHCCLTDTEDIFLLKYIEEREELEEQLEELKKQLEELKDYIKRKQNENLKLYKVLYEIQDLLENFYD